MKNIISIKYSKKLRKKIKPIDIIYKPVTPPEKKVSVTTLQIHQNHTELLAQTPKIFGMGLSLSVIIVESFLQELTNKKDTLNIVLVCLE